MNTFDIGIIGSGIAGTFAAYKIAKEHKNAKVILIDIGRPPQKRRQQMNGFLGVLPNSDGKLYLNDQESIASIVGNKKAKSSVKWVNNIISNVNDFKIIKDKSPSISTVKKITKAGYDLKLNDHVQMIPKEIHALSKFMSNQMDLSANITYHFDDEVLSISKQKNMFTLNTEFKEFKCKKILMAVGRSGWRWAHDIYSNFGIIESNDVAKYGVRIEMPSGYLKDFNKSNCTLTKGNDLEIGPFSWFGTVIPEDHFDLAISSFRSNENRWETDKVSFAFMGNMPTDGDGTQQVDRIGKLTFILANDRIIKEKVSTLMARKSKISIMPEYDWLIEGLKHLSSVIPDVLTRAYFHVPTIMPMAPNINIGDDMSTEVDGMFVAGESAGITGILSAAAMGSLAVDGMLK